VACLPSGVALRCSLEEPGEFNGFQTRWAHRLEVYVPTYPPCTGGILVISSEVEKSLGAIASCERLSALNRRHDCNLFARFDFVIAIHKFQACAN
jgi:hypothetical protein